MRKLLLTTIISLFITNSQLSAHCQMPCGIYHDDMVYDQIDQYAETMYKAVSEINSSKFQTAKERNQFVRWVLEKEKESDEAAKIMTVYFLQQKIKPGEEDTTEKTLLAQKLLFLMVQIKQNTDIKLVYEFMDEWEKFKHMFHREGYECRIEKVKLKKWAQERENLIKEEESKKKN
jgi:nickel superoxide dismutase